MNFTINCRPWRMNNHALFVGLVAVILLSGGCTTVRSGGVTVSEAVPAPLPPDALYRALVAEMAAQRGQFDVATEHYQALTRSTHDPRVAERATRAAAMERNDQKVLELARQWLEISPRSLDARLFIAAALIRQGRFDAAGEHVDLILAGSTNAPDRGFGAVSSLLFNVPDSRAALTFMEKVVAGHQDDPYAQYAYGQLALRAEALDVAMRAAEAAQRLKPGWVNAVLLQARALQLQGESGRAADVLQEVVNKQPEDAGVRMIYARLLLSASRYEASLAQFERLAVQTPDNPEVLLTAALIAIDLKRLEVAEGYLNRLLAQSQQVNEASYYLGVVAEARKDPATARKWYQAVADGEHYLSAQLRLAMIVADQGDVDGALNSIRAMIPGDAAQKARIASITGSILYQAERYAQAMEVYDAALKEAPEHVDLLHGRALVAEKLDRLDIVEQDLTAILQREPTNAAVLNTLGYTLADRTTRYQEAYDYIKRALDLDPEDFAILDSMGWVLFKLGRHAEALVYLRRSWDAGQDAKVAAHLGEVLWVMGDQPGAREIWQRALAKTPNHKALRGVMQRFGIK